MQNYFAIAFRSNVDNLAAMKSAFMASIYQMCGYHDNCLNFLQIHDVSIKRINRTKPTTTNQKVIYLLMLGEQFRYLSILLQV